MATYSSILAWEIPWTEEPSGLESMGSQRVRNDLVTKQEQIGRASCREKSVCLRGQDPLEKEMATHSSILAWEIPWTDKPGGLQSMGLQRVQHD